MSDDPAKYEVLIKQDLHSILDISVDLMKNTIFGKSCGLLSTFGPVHLDVACDL